MDVNAFCFSNSFDRIEAESKTPFGEHRGSDGKTYAEVEPDAEYYIRIRSKTQVGGEGERGVRGHRGRDERGERGRGARRGPG